MTIEKEEQAAAATVVAIFAAAKSNEEYYKGLAIGLGAAAAYLSPEVLKEEITSNLKEKNNNKTEFAQNFGFSLGHAFSSLDAKKKKEVFETMKNDEQFLAGLGEGAGHYLPLTGGGTLEEVIINDYYNKGIFQAGYPQLERGAAAGVAESFNHLDLAEVVGILQYACSHVEFGKVLGEHLAAKFASLDDYNISFKSSIRCKQIVILPKHLPKQFQKIIIIILDTSHLNSSKE